MAFAGSITYDGTISLSSANIAISKYVPNTAPVGEEYVTDSIRLQLSSTTSAGLGSIINDLTKAVRRAYEYSQTLAGTPVYLYYQPDGYSEAYRSEIVARPGEKEAGRLVLEDNSQDWATWVNSHTIWANLTFNRRNYWEGTADVQIPITNPNGTLNTAGLKVYYENDGLGGAGSLHYNYFDVPGTAVAGDLPAGCRIEAVTNQAGTLLSYAFYQNASGYSASLVHTYEGEATGFGTATPNATSSGTAYSRSGVAAGGTLSAAWTIGTAALSQMASNYFDIQADMRVLNAGTYTITPYMVMGGDEWVYGPSTILTTAGSVPFRPVDLGVMKIPSKSYGVTHGAVTFGIRVVSAGAGTVDLDYLMLLGADGVAQANYPSTWVTAADTVVVSSLVQYAYGLLSGNTTWEMPYTGGGIYLRPGQTQRLYQVVQAWMYGSYSTMKLYYRPRKHLL